MAGKLVKLVNLEKHKQKQVLGLFNSLVLQSFFLLYPTRE